MKYQIHILRRGQKSLEKLAEPAFTAICNLIKSLTDQPRPTGCLKLTGREGWRIRSGHYRVIYEIDDTLKQVTVLDIGHRRDIYS